MVVRRTNTREFGPTTGWSDEDGTTTTYQRHAHAGGPRAVGMPAPRAFQRSALAPAMAGTPALTSVYARGAQPNLAAPALDELDLDSHPFARRRGAASASVWSALAFAGLFASVLFGRVIVHAGLERAHAAESRTPSTAQTRANATMPSATSARVGAAGVAAAAPVEDRRNAAALAPPALQESAAQPEHVASQLDPSASSMAATAGTQAADSTPLPAPSEPPTKNPRSVDASPQLDPAAPDSNPRRGSEANVTPAARSNPRPTADSVDAPPPAAQRNNARRESEPAEDAPRVARSGPSANERSGAAASGTQPAADARSGTGDAVRSQRARPSRSQAASSSDWRDGPMEPAQLNSASVATSLPASDSPAALGTLRINSRPWTQVFLDGRLIGATPQMNVRVPAGRYSVRLTNPELGMSKTIVVQVAAGEIVTRVESLE